MGRKIAFNVSLMICSVFAIVAGASPNWEVSLILERGVRERERKG